MNDNLPNVQYKKRLGAHVIDYDQYMFSNVLNGLMFVAKDEMIRWKRRVPTCARARSTLA